MVVGAWMKASPGGYLYHNADGFSGVALTFNTPENKEISHMYLFLAKKPTTPQKGSIEVQKILKGEALNDGITKVKFKLERRVIGTTDAYTSFEANPTVYEIDITDPAPYKTTVDGLDRGYEYQPVEVAVYSGNDELNLESYTRSYESAVLKIKTGSAVPLATNLPTATITNDRTNTPVDPDKGSITVTKKYEGLLPGTAGDAVKVQLQKKDNNGNYQNVGGDVQVIPGTPYTFNNLDLDATYKVVEVDVPTEYTKSYELVIGGDTKPLTNEVCLGGGVKEATVNITNTKTPTPPPTEESKGSITVNKKWSGIVGQQEVKIRLLQNNDQIDSAKLDADHNWTHTFANLDLNATYKVEEVVPTGYKASYELVIGEATTQSTNEVYLSDNVKGATVTITNTQNSSGDGDGGNPTGDGGRYDSYTTPTVDTVINPPVNTVITDPAPVEDEEVTYVPEKKNKVIKEKEAVKNKVLPNTAEIPLQMFYGMSGVLAGLGIYLGRKKK